MKEEGIILINRFTTPEDFRIMAKKELGGPNGWMLFVACNSAIKFADAVKTQYESMLADKNSHLTEIPILGTQENPITKVFTDTECRPRLRQSVSGAAAYVFQCIHEFDSDNTVNENIQQLLQVIRTVRAHRAKTIIVIIPYSPYSRQDKPTFMKREATLSSLFADQLKAAGTDICATYHPHSYSLYGFYEPDVRFVALSGLDLFIDIFSWAKGRKDVVVVSTDAGGSKYTIQFADLMDLTYAISSKFRSDHNKTTHLGIIGDLRDKNIALITDDETVTGTSAINAVKSLYTDYGIKEIYLGISHFKVPTQYLPRFVEAHKKYGLKEVHITDSIPQRKEVYELDFIKVHSLARRFAGTINGIHYNQSISKLSKYDLSK